jgi:Xaa-Pro aminopeptidase
MFIDFGCNYRHYLSDAGVTLAAGSLPERELEAHRVLVDSIRAGAELLTPGRKASSVQAGMIQVLSHANLTSCFAHGHGIGLELRNYPILVPDTGRTIRDDCIELPADLPLENGMVINLEAPLFEHDGAAFQVEQSYLVTPGGGEPLTSRDLNHLRVT